jgi:hypothetical protein
MKTRLGEDSKRVGSHALWRGRGVNRTGLLSIRDDVGALISSFRHRRISELRRSCLASVSLTSLTSLMPLTSLCRRCRGTDCSC